MERDDIILGMLDRAHSAYRHASTEDGAMLSAIRAALAFLDHEADLSILSRYSQGEWSRRTLNSMRQDIFEE